MNAIISYRTVDRAIVDELDGLLASENLAVWIDYKGIRAGFPWRGEIFDQLRKSKVCITVLSKAYLQSEHCRMEVFLARSFGSIVVPLMIDDCFGDLDKFEETNRLGDIFMMRLYHLQSVGLTISREEALGRVVKGVQHALSPQPSSHRVYVSYSGNLDGEFATSVAENLARAGVASWVATRSVFVGENWRDAQVRGLSAASYHVVVLDEKIVNSRVLRTELIMSEALGIPLVTVLPPRLKRDKAKIDSMMGQLNASDQTYRRLTEKQFFSPESIDELSLFVAHDLNLRPGNMPAKLTAVG